MGSYVPELQIGLRVGEHEPSLRDQDSRGSVEDGPVLRVEVEETALCSEWTIGIRLFSFTKLISIRLV